MYIFLRNNDYRYAAEQMLLMLFPEERPVYPSADLGLREENAVELELKHGKTYTTAVCRLRYDRRTAQNHVRARTDGIRTEEEGARIEQRILKLAFYRAALDVGVPKPEWGCLTGVRPAKFLAGLMQKDGLTETAAVRMLTETFGVSKERASLALAAERAAARAKAVLAPQDVCLYIGIPFCPTRCAYCSFVSVDAPKLLKSIPDYLNALEQEMRSTAAAVKAAGRRVMAMVTDMDQPLGHNIGNALEIIEAAEILKGRDSGRACRLCLEVAARMVMLSFGTAHDTAYAQVQDALKSGSGLEKLRQMLAAQGGNANVLDDYSLLPQANEKLDVFAEKDGFISFLEAQKLGLASKALGAGRSTKDAPVDYAVGIVLHKQVGDAVSAGEVLATLYINDRAELGQAMEMLRSAIVVSDKKPAERPLIYETIE